MHPNLHVQRFADLPSPKSADSLRPNSRQSAILCKYLWQ